MTLKVSTATGTVLQYRLSFLVTAGLSFLVKLTNSTASYQSIFAQIDFPLFTQWHPTYNHACKTEWCSFAV